MIRVLIVSPNTAVRQGLVALCQTEPELEVRETAVASLSPSAGQTEPHITLVDGQQIEKSIEIVRQIKMAYPQTQLLLLVNTLDSDTIWQAARAGAAHCLLKQDSAHNLVPTIQTYYQQIKNLDNS
jgi:DNA-binding NarL/FixJ family response regulator